MNENNQYDVVVVGGGPGGYTAAFRAADLGLSVCLVDKRENLGGVCLNEGCIPSKTLLHGTSFLDIQEDAAEYGVLYDSPHFDIGTLGAKRDRVVAQLTGGLSRLSEARRITRLTGKAFFKDSNTILFSGSTGESIVKFKQAIIATGSSPSVLNGIPEHELIWDSSDALALKFVPPRLLIIGGGVIGLEMAQVYSALGSSITIVEMDKQIIPVADKDLIQPLLRKVKKIYTILTKSKVTSMVIEGDHVVATITGAKESIPLEFDAVLVAVGRTPNSSGIGLTNAGVDLNHRGFVGVDSNQQTSVENFYAVGDVTGDPMLAHKASFEAKVAVEYIVEKKSENSIKIIPSVSYTNPELAWAGYTEKEAKDTGIQYNRVKYPWGANGRALSSGQENGITKLLFEKESGKLIGAGICGAHAGELIHELVLAIHKEHTAKDLETTIHAHPTFAETIGHAAETFLGSITEAMPVKKRNIF